MYDVTPVDARKWHRHFLRPVIYFESVGARIEPLRKENARGGAGDRVFLTVPPPLTMFSTCVVVRAAR